MKKISVSKAFFLGLATAMVTALLTPKTGKQVRTDLKGKAKELVDTGKEKVKNLVQDTKEAYQEAEQELEQTKKYESTASVSSTAVSSTAEKGEEWLNHISDADTISEYPDASVTNTTGIFADQLTPLPADETYTPTFSDELKKEASPEAPNTNQTQTDLSQSPNLQTTPREPYPFAEELLDELEDTLEQKKQTNTN